MHAIYGFIIAFSLLSVTSIIVTLTLLFINTSTTVKLAASDLTHEWVIEYNSSFQFPPFITDINGQLLHVLLSAGDAAGVVRLESSGSSCQFPLSSPENVERILAVAGMKIGAVAVAVMERGNKENEDILRVNAISDRYMCPRPAINTLVLKRDTGGGGRRVKVFGYQNTFDIFFKNDDYCGLGYLCRISYDFQGHLVNNSRDSVLTSLSGDWGIDVATKNNRSSGFFYRELDTNHKYRIVKFDSDLKFVRIRRWNKMRLYSATQGRVTICEDISKIDLKCTFLDSNLTNVATAMIPMDEHVQIAAPLELFNTPDGGAIILYDLRGNHSLQYKKEMVFTYIRIIGSDGSVGKLTKFFDHNICERHQIDVVEMDPGLCFRLSCLERNSLSVKCIVENKNRFMNDEWL